MCKRFDIRYYNCWHLVQDVWATLTGVDLGLPTLDKHTVAECGGVVSDWVGTRYEQIEKPVSPCIVLFQKDKYRPHVGVFFRGKVIHIKIQGTRYQSVRLAALGFDSVRYFKPCTQS